VKRVALISLIAALITGCSAAVVPIIPTAQPTATPSPTPAPTVTRDFALQAEPPTPRPTQEGGATATPLFGGAAAPPTAAPTSIAAVNPNAPRIEFFTADAAAVPPGGTITLYWSTRNASEAVIYQIENGVRSRVWNVGPDGRLPVQTRRNDRGTIAFVISVGTSTQRIEQPLTIPLACPDGWFFAPAPLDCPLRPAQESQVIEQPFERGRMVYIAALNRVYSLFNDGFAPAWVVIDDRYDPAIHPLSEPSFPVPPGFFQPIAQLGFVWRGNDLVRNRLGLGTQPESRFAGQLQVARTDGGGETLYVSSADSSVLRLLAGGSAWEIITPPR
jgi:hypothetical protein